MRSSHASRHGVAFRALRPRLSTMLWTAAGLAVVVYLSLCLLFALRDPLPRPFTREELDAPLALPRGFLWGTATSAHQVEGGNRYNDWWAFEQQPGRIAGGDRSGRAADHWNRVSEDIALMKRLGANAYRFSVEWSRVEPREGSWDEDAWEHYRDEVHQLRAAGIEPMVTLFHFTLPSWLAGGVLSGTFPERFARFASEAARRLGSNVTLWCTLNEPNVFMYKGFVEAVWPPALKDNQKASAVFANLLRAHAAAAAAIRAAVPGARLGVAMHLRVFDPGRRWFLPDWIAAHVAGDGFNWAFYDSITSGRIHLALPGFPKLDQALPGLQGSADWLGVNYYSRDVVRFSPRAAGFATLTPGSGPRSDLEWEVYPEGLLRLLHSAYARYNLPIYVTENGVDDRTGRLRGAFLRAHAHAVALAAHQGIPVLGYFYWSLLDNFEWAEGFKPRFGLYSVDYATMARTPAPGAEVFTALAAEAPR